MEDHSRLEPATIEPETIGPEKVEPEGIEPASSTAEVTPAVVAVETEQGVQQGGTTRGSQTSVSAALAAAAAEARAGMPPAVKFPPEDHGRSLAEMAHRDLDAALQLLASRAQYITGANGAAIALRRHGKNDMLCRASTGSNAPELGALLSTEFGLSGESVRTRKPLRCDDAERDARVNREVCQQLGIASVVVMPVVNDDEVLGVFELFSGKANAFGERDLSALQRLSEMVETAVKLARAAESVPELAATELPEEEILETDVAGQVADEASVRPNVVPVDEPARAEEKAQVAAASPAGKEVEKVTTQASLPAESRIEVPKAAAPTSAPATPASPKKPLFWSAALDTSEAEKAAETDHSNVPPMLRNLKKCEACGFPVSAGRVLCVECEEKKWRGQLKPQRPSVVQPSAPAAAATVPEPISAPVARLMAAASATASAPASGLARRNQPLEGSSAAAPAVVKKVESPAGAVTPAVVIPPEAAAPSAPAVAPAVSIPPAEPPKIAVAPTLEPAKVERADVAPPAFVLSAGLEPSQSWLSRNKYVLGAIVLIAAVVAAVLILR